MARVSKIKGKNYLILDIEDFKGFTTSADTRPTFEDYTTGQFGFLLVGRKVSIEHAVFISERSNTNIGNLYSYTDLFEYFPEDEEWLNVYIKKSIAEGNEDTVLQLLTNDECSKNLLPRIDKVKFQDESVYLDFLIDDFKRNDDLEMIDAILSIIKDIDIDSANLTLFLNVFDSYISGPARTNWNETQIENAIQEVGDSVIVLSFRKDPEYLEEIIVKFSTLVEKMLDHDELNDGVRGAINFTSNAILEAANSTLDPDKYQKLHLKMLENLFCRFFVKGQVFEEFDKVIDMFGLLSEEADTIKTNVKNYVADKLFSRFVRGKKLDQVGLLFDSVSKANILNYKPVIVHAITIKHAETVRNIASAIDRSATRAGAVCAHICDVLQDDPDVLKNFVYIVTGASKLSDSRRNQNGSSNLMFTNEFFNKLDALGFDPALLGDVPRVSLSSYGRVLQAMAL